MKTKNKMMVVLLIISALTAGLIPAYAVPNQLSAKRIPNAAVLKPAPTNTIREVKSAVITDLSDLDESTVDKRISEAENAEPVEEVTGSVLWYLNAYGYTTAESPVMDAAQSRFRIRLQIVAEKVKNTKFGVLYEIHWGRVTHNGEQYEVEGYALLDSDGVFYMKLNGEIAFKSIGRIHSSWFGVRISMKGYLVDEDITYNHNMRGWAIPLTINLITRLRNHLQ
ncbi:hypothetical protein ACFL0D_05225 [Thermoproteota archaeon]